MTRRHPPEPEIYFQRQRTSPLTATRGGPHAYSLVQRPLTNPAHLDTDSKGQARKRIAVAVWEPLSANTQ